jgi:glyoxylase-like metal-dependent hydrolase (beta-lactamase superfamily II)
MVQATVNPLDRGRLRLDTNFAFEGDSLGTFDNPDADNELIDFVVYNLLIDHPEATILVDTGSHPDAADGYWPEHVYQLFAHYDADERTLETALDEQGYSVDDIDAVVQTHLHLDHAGGLYHFDGTDVPIYVHETELKTAYFGGKVAGDPAFVTEDFDRDLNWEPVHLSEITPWEDVTLHHFPGHTPGVMGLSIDLANDGTLLFTSDECLQEGNYEGQPMGAVLLNERADWFDSLQRIYEIERTRNATVYTGHDLDQFESFPDNWS